MRSYFDVQLFLSIFVTLMVIMNPPGAVPIFLGLTASLTHKHPFAGRAMPLSAESIWCPKTGAVKGW